MQAPIKTIRVINPMPLRITNEPPFPPSEETAIGVLTILGGR